MSRRELLRKLTLAATATNLSCHEKCGPDPDRIFVIIFGQDASAVLFLLHFFGPGFFSPLTAAPRRIALDSAPAADTTSLNGICAGTVSGPRPAALGGSQARSVYLLDTLGDDKVDGRVYALDVDGETLQLRGEVGLRPIDNAAPFIALRHIALSDDGGTIVVSQEGGPPQWIFVDAASLEVTGRVMAPAGQLARRAIFSPDAKLAYVVAGENSSTNPPAALHVVDVAANSIAHTFDLPANTPIADLAVTPDQGLLIGVAGRFIHAFDLRTGTYSGAADVLRPVSDPQGAMVARFNRVVMHPNGAEFYAGPIEFFAEDRFAVGAFDVQSLAKTKEMTVQERPSVGTPLLSLSPSGSSLTYAVQLGTVVQTFDTASATQIDAVPIEQSFRLTNLVAT